MLHLREIWKLFRNSKLFWFTEHSDRVYMESEARYYFRCDHWPWSRSFCVVGPILSVVFQWKSRNDAFKGTLPIKVGRSRGILSKCRAYWRIEIHVSRFRYDNSHYLASSLHLFLPHNLSLSSLFSLALSPHFHCHPIIHHLLFTPCVIALSPYPLPPPPSFLAILLLVPLHCFFTSSFRAQRETSGTGSSRILISQFVAYESCQTAFPVNL